MNDKLNSYDTTIEFVKNATEDNMKKILSHEDNLNNLNRVVEDQVKSLEKEKGNIENNRLEIEKLKELIDNYNNEINKLDTKIIENNNKITETLNDISSQNTDNINNINIKIRDLNSNISNLANNINQLNSKTGIQNQVEIKEIKETPKIENKPIKIEKIDNTNIEGDTIINTTNDNTIITRNLQRKISNPLNKIEHIPVPDEIPDTLTKDDIDFIYNKIKSFDKINQASKVHYDKELNNLNQKLIQLQTIIKKQKSGQELFDNNIPPITNNISMIEEPSTIPDININKGSDDVLKKVSETLRMFSNSIENKASLKKLDELNSNVDKKIKALGDKFQNAINILENKYKLGNNQMNNNNKNEGENNNNNFDYDILVQNINVEILKKIEENIKDMVQNKIDQFDLTSNPNIENLNKILEEHKDE